MLAPRHRRRASFTPCTARRSPPRAHGDGTTGHPWIYRSDLVTSARRPTPASCASWISAASRSASRSGARARRSRCACSTAIPDAPIDGEWWHARSRAPIARREPLDARRERVPPRARRRRRHPVARRRSLRPMARRPADERRARALPRRRSSTRSIELVQPDGILARNDVPLRAKEGLDTNVELLARRRCPTRSRWTSTACATSPHRGPDRRPGAFLDQRENRALVGASRAAARSTASATTARSRCTSRDARDHVIALDASAHALTRAEENSARNGLTNVEFVEANAFEYLKPASASARDSTRSCSIRRRSRRRAPRCRRAARLQGDQPARDAPARARRDALHGELPLPSHEAAVPRDARGAAADSGRASCCASCAASRSIIPRC